MCIRDRGSDEDYVLSAIKGGYQELGFSDHTPWKYHTDYVADMRMLLILTFSTDLNLQ